MQQDAEQDQAIADFLAEKNCADAKRKNVKIGKRNGDNEMICIGHRSNRAQDQNEWQPAPSARRQALAQKRWHPNRVNLVAQPAKHEFSNGGMHDGRSLKENFLHHPFVFWIEKMARKLRHDPDGGIDV